MPKYTFQAEGTEDRLTNVNYQKNVTLDGNLIEIGKHTVVISGRGSLSHNDSVDLGKLADDQDDEDAVVIQGEIVVGPLWQKVNQCVPIVAGGGYFNSDSDEDDWQGWDIRKDQWDTIDEGVTMRQLGQSTRFHSINYKVSATGDLADTCDKEVKITEATSSGNLNPQLPEPHVFDGKLDTKWISTNIAKPWIRVSLEGQTPVCRVEIAWAEGNNRKYKFYIEVSPDATGDQNWGTPVFTGESTGGTTSLEPYSVTAPPIKRVKITITESSPGPVPIQISEIKVFSNTL
jgi:hypothetical protein